MSVLTDEGLEILVQRILSRIDRSIDGCWIWPGARSKRGYGYISLSGAGTFAVHRLMFMAFHGSIPVGMDVHHKCENPPCCNPSCLKLKEHGKHGSISMRPDQSKCRAGLHQWIPENLRRTNGNHLTCRLCSNDRLRESRARKRSRDAA